MKFEIFVREFLNDSWFDKITKNRSLKTSYLIVKLQNGLRNIMGFVLTLSFHSFSFGRLLEDFLLI